MQAIPLEQRKEAFARLGEAMRAAADGAPPTAATAAAVARLTRALPLARNANPWFDEENVRRALLAIGTVLTKENLQRWLAHYPQLADYPGGKEVLVIMAGNIPLVGFHDLLSVLITGHRLVVRTSSRDAGLHRLVALILTELEPAFKPFIRFTRERPAHLDAVIATGSDNTARYFEHLYHDLPAIIRRNRNSLAVLDGTETDEEMRGLARDIFWYYGLGCRSVSKIMVPEDYDIEKHLFPFFREYHKVNLLPAYQHNLQYQRAVLTTDNIPFLDAGNLLLTEDTALASPIGMLHYERYKNLNYVVNYVATYVDKIQCLVGNIPAHINSIPFGMSQFPELWDYADGIDTIDFLIEL